MPRVRLIEHYAGRVPGDEMEIDGGRASVLALRRVVEILPEPGVAPVAMEQDSGGYALPESAPSPEATALVVSDETLHRLAEERGFVLAPEDAVVRIAEILGADEETGLLAAAESWAEGRDGLERDLGVAKAATTRLEGELTALRSAPAPAFGQADFEAYAVAHGLRFDTAENLEALIAQAHAPLSEDEVLAYAQASGRMLVAKIQDEPPTPEPAKPGRK